jgi:hypothetical protein
LFSSHILQLQQKTKSVCYFLLKHTVFLPGWISCATLEKKHMVFPFSVGTFVLPRLPKIVCWVAKKHMVF